MKNEIRLILGDTAVMELTQGKLCMVDVADLEMLGKRRWCYCKSRDADQGYPTTAIKGKLVRMQAFLMGVSGRSVKVDHISRDRLDNRRENLRISTSSQNSGNVEKNSRNKSGYKGVSWSKDNQKWLAQINARANVGPGRPRKNLGLYDKKEDAARAYDAAALNRWGEFACINFPLPAYAPVS